MAKHYKKLISAAEIGDFAEVSRLIPKSNARAQEKHGNTALMLACMGRWGSIESRIACVNALLPVSDANATNNRGETALMIAAASGLTKCLELLLPVSDTNARERWGNTALMLAAIWGRVEVVKALLPDSDLTAIDTRAPRRQQGRKKRRDTNADQRRQFQTGGAAPSNKTLDTDRR
jgi:ankyrin repeat protein